jgi:hypothetical protein
LLHALSLRSTLHKRHCRVLPCLPALPVTLLRGVRISALKPNAKAQSFLNNAFPLPRLPRRGISWVNRVESCEAASPVLALSPPRLHSGQKPPPSNVRRKVSDLAGSSRGNRYGQFSWPFRLVRADDDGHRGSPGVLRRVVGWSKEYLLPLEVCKRADELLVHPVARVLRLSC